jgi:hypothetical protein
MKLCVQNHLPEQSRINSQAATRISDLHQETCHIGNLTYVIHLSALFWKTRFANVTVVTDIHRDSF